MANHKSALKRAKQNKKRNLRNRSLLSALKTELKKFQIILEEKKIDELKKALSLIHKIIDKTQTKGVITKNAASRKKSKLTCLTNSILKEA